MAVNGVGRRVLVALLVAGVVAGGVLVALTATLLPERVPTHFTLAGRPDGWSSRSGALGFALVLWLGTNAVLTGLALASGRLPLHLVRVPHAEHWAAPEHQPELRRRLRGLLLAVAAAGAWFVVVVLGGVVAAGLDPRGTAPWWSTASALALTVLLVAVAVVGARRTYRLPLAPSPRP